MITVSFQEEGKCVPHLNQSLKETDVLDPGGKTKDILFYTKLSIHMG